jgi:hypothetical protein
MSVSSPVLDDVARAVRAGAHLVLRGHLRDELLLDGRIVTARWALGRALRDRAGLDAVVFVGADRGVNCARHEGREDVERVLAGIAAERDSFGTPIPRRLGGKTPVEIAGTVLALMRQSEIAVAVVLDDLDVIVNPSDEPGRRAIALLRRAVAEAECIPGKGPQAPHNTIIALDSPLCPLGAGLASIPGVQVIEVAPPDRETRAAALAGMARRFYGSDVRSRSRSAGLELIADRMAGCSLRDLEQLRRLSHEHRISPSRPAALLAARLPRRGLNPVAKIGVDAIMEELAASVVGQPCALTRMRALLEDARYPNAARGRGTTPTTPLMVVFAFGPPGIGKTETARALGRALFGSEAGIVRIDCGEYQSGHDVARLTGAPPGYIGYDGGGQLTEPLRRGPAVVIFDEFEKPQHEALVDLLLAILDEGRLTDGGGETVTFERAIVMFTTNLGSAELEAERHASTEEFLRSSEQLVRDRISKREDGGMGRPELLSRLEGALVPFDFLRFEALPAVVAKYCSNIAANLGDELDVSLQIDAGQFAEVFRAQLDVDRWDGRVVERLARRHVEGPLREQLARFEGGSGRVVPDAHGLATIIGAVSERTAT